MAVGLFARLFCWTGLKLQLPSGGCPIIAQQAA
jgi:hypothetical protein